MALSVNEKDGGLVFRVRVIPRASVNKVVGVYEDALKVKLKAPPVDGAANKMCIQYLAKVFKVSKSCVEIVGGASSRSKLIRVTPRENGSEKGLAGLRQIIESLS